MYVNLNKLAVYGKFENIFVPHNFVAACGVCGESASTLVLVFLLKFVCIKLGYIFILRLFSQ